MRVLMTAALVGAVAASCMLMTSCESEPQIMAELEPYSVSGTVSDSATAVPLPGVTVLRNAIVEATTDSTGSYYVPLGWSLLGTLEFASDGYHSRTFDIPELPEVCTAQSGRAFRLDVLLSNR